MSWLRSRRRERLLAAPFPPEWLPYLDANVRLYRALPEAERAQLRDALRVFIAEKTWEGCGGLELGDEIRVTIAAQACYLVLGWPGYHLDEVKTILVYPDAYVAPGDKGFRYGVVHDGPSVRGGESWSFRTVVLSWADALAGGRDAADGRNLVFHEFAHQLDMLDGVADGTPPLQGAARDRRWREVLAEEFTRLARESVRGHATLLDPYGSTNEAEFFAVATECFFERPAAMAERHPELFEILRGFYRRDPRA